MPRFMMGTLTVTSACLGYLLATLWDRQGRDGRKPGSGFRPTPGLPRWSPPEERRALGYDDYPLGV